MSTESWFLILLISVAAAAAVAAIIFLRHRARDHHAAEKLRSNNPFSAGDGIRAADCRGSTPSDGFAQLQRSGNVPSGAPTGGQRVFISHSSKDQAVVETLCAALENRGVACWLASRDVDPGENFQQSIHRAIRSAKVMVLVFTKNANTSPEINKEIALAGQYQLVVIPVRVEDVVPNDALAYELATRQWIDLFRDWEHNIERLSSRIAAIASIEPVAAPGSKPPMHSAGQPVAAALPIRRQTS